MTQVGADVGILTNKYLQTRQSGPLLRSKSTENSQIKRRTVKRSEAGTEQLVEVSRNS